VPEVGGLRAPSKAQIEIYHVQEDGMRTILQTSVLALAIVSIIGVTGPIAQPAKNQPDPRPQAGAANRYVMCLGQASSLRLLPGSEARKLFLKKCLRRK
jgi:hypothetical protein